MVDEYRDLRNCNRRYHRRNCRDISDEFDDDDLVYSKLDDYNYVFEGKTALNDFYRILDIDGEEFEEVKGESDSLAGFILETIGACPRRLS